MSKKITDYWMAHYVEHGICSLCGNYGVVDTSGVRSPAGIIVGRKNYCFCPNGQTLRRINEPKPEAAE